jgi:heterodisulfide reductase subunit C
MQVLKNIAVREGIVPPSFQIQAKAIREQGKLYEIEDFDNKKRARMGLPELEKKCPDVEILFCKGTLKDM